MLRKYGVFITMALFLGACQASPTFLNPASPIAEHQANLYRTVLIMALVVFVMVEGGIIWIVVSHRKRSGDDELPPQIHNNAQLEVVWTAIPILLVIALFVMTVRTVNAVALPQKTDMTIRVVGHQWWWEFDYLDEGVATANELHIPVGTNVMIELESVDVIHSFWVPQLAGKTDVIPGQHNTMWITGDQVGEYLGQCAEFCGTQHALMRFKVFVDSQDDFDAWLANQQKPAYQPQTEDEQIGFKEIDTGACAACHSLDPTEIDTDKVGPNLTHLFSRTTFAGGSYELNEENLRNWLHDTQAMKQGNDMEITVPDRQFEQVIAYLMKLK